MAGFVRSRIHVGAWAVLIILIILFLQNSLSWNLLVGKFVSPDSRLFFGEEISNQIWTIVKLVILVPTIAFLILDWRRLLRISIILDNLLLTFELLVSIISVGPYFRNRHTCSCLLAYKRYLADHGD
jgi:hypothetical protein